MRLHGFHLAFDAIGNGDLPLSIIVDLQPEMIKLDPRLLRGMPRDPAAVAVVEAVAQLCSRTGIQLAAVGVETGDQLVTLSRLGVRLAQGNLFAAPDDQASIPDDLARTATELIELDAAPSAASDATPLIADVLREAVTMPDTATANDVRDAFVEQPTINGVVPVSGRARASSASSRPVRVDSMGWYAYDSPGTGATAHSGPPTASGQPMSPSVHLASQRFTWPATVRTAVGRPS